jgi:hypothetical protein
MGSGRDELKRLRDNSILTSILGGAAVHRCDKSCFQKRLQPLRGRSTKMSFSAASSIVPSLDQFKDGGFSSLCHPETYSRTLSSSFFLPQSAAACTKARITGCGFFSVEDSCG